MAETCELCGCGLVAAPDGAICPECGEPAQDKADSGKLKTEMK